MRIRFKIFGNYSIIFSNWKNNKFIFAKMKYEITANLLNSL